MVIRIARESDAIAIAAGERATAETPGMLVGRPGEIPLHAYASKIDHLETHGRYVVAEEVGAVVGHAFLDPFDMIANSHAFRLTIVVHPAHVGRGIGRALLQDLLDWAASDARVHKVELLVRATNERAIGLYRKLGFVEEGRFRRRVKLPDGSFVDDLAMAWFPGPTQAAARSIRNAHAKDVEPMIELAHRSWLSAFAQTAPFALIAWWARTDRTRSLYEQDWMGMSVLEEKDVVIGLVQPKQAEINGLWVQPDRQGSGAGTELLNYGEGVIRRAGHGAAWLTCSSFNASALEFYRRRGYLETGRTRYLHASGIEVEDVRMERSLQG